MTQSIAGSEALLIPNHPSEAAYLELLPKISAIEEAELVPINTDVLTAITTVLGALPAIQALRPQIEAEWRRFDFERFDRLETYALALSHAHALWRGASVPKGAVVGLADELSDIRDQLLLDAKALAGRSLLDGDRLKNCKMQPGYRPLASDVLTIVAVLKERWSALAGKTPLTLAELNEAASKATDLLAAVGLKEQAPTTAGEAGLIRPKIFGLFASAYEDARRAVLYLRAKEEDGGDIAPSIYGGRVRRGGADSAESATPATPGASSDSTAPTSGPAITINSPCSWSWSKKPCARRSPSS